MGEDAVPAQLTIVRHTFTANGHLWKITVKFDFMNGEPAELMEQKKA